jgi:DNA gyrase/topoisomerase IV subunit A
MSDFKKTIEESFIQYSGAVIQSRALVDARDGLKPSARQILYCMDMCKYTSDKPFQATAAVVGDAMKYFYIHGDSSCCGVIMRAGQPFAMRYPLVEVGGNGGTLIEAGNWAASRYTKSRLSKVGDALFIDIKKDTIAEWRDNFSDTEQYPSVLPSKGFYNIVNGTQGISVGMASSIPQFNLKEVNEAMIRLLDNPNIEDEKIVCMPDFATGATLINADEVKQSLINGTGKACILRAVINYDEKDNCLVVSEIPYGVYTNTICGQLECILESEDNPGIERFNDLTGKTPIIKIYLRKKVNVQKVIDFLYKNTSLQYWYGINLTMLDRGRFPKVYRWKEALQAHIDHEKLVYRNSFEFDKKEAKKHLNIIEGLLIAIADIDSIIKLIKVSGSRSEAKEKLMAVYNFNEEQVNAILDMKLSRLAHLEIEKLETEKGELIAQIKRIDEILVDEQLFNRQIISGWRKMILQFGDARRTVVANIDLSKTSVSAEDSTPKDIVVMRSGSQLYIMEKPRSSISTSTKSSLTAKMKFDEVVSCSTKNRLLVYTKTGQLTLVNLAELEIGAITPLTTDGEVAGMCIEEPKKFLISLTKNGVVKKSEAAEYTFKRTTYVCKLKEDDEIVWVGYANDDDFLLAFGENDKALKVAVEKLSTTGKNTQGSRFMSCIVRCAVCGSNTSIVISVSGEKLKATSMDEYVEGAKGGSGVVVNEGTTGCWIGVANFFLLTNGTKLSPAVLDTYPLKSRTATGATVKGLISLSH